jgi:hypothetical protein
MTARYFDFVKIWIKNGMGTMRRVRSHDVVQNEWDSGRLLVLEEMHRFQMKCLNVLENYFVITNLINI